MVVYNVEGNTSIDVDDYINSFYFGIHEQLSAIRGQVEAGATGYEYFIESLETEAKQQPYNKDASGDMII